MRAGQGYLVGERGPEPFFPGVNGMIFPNSALAGAAPAGGDITINIDGVQDPTIVRTEIARAVPAIQAANNARFTADMNRRSQLRSAMVAGSRR